MERIGFDFLGRFVLGDSFSQPRSNKADWESGTSVSDDALDYAFGYDSRSADLFPTYVGDALRTLVS